MKTSGAPPVQNRRTIPVVLFALLAAARAIAGDGVPVHVPPGVFAASNFTIHIDVAALKRELRAVLDQLQR